MHGGRGLGHRDGARRGPSRWVPAAVATLAALLVLGPGLGRGYLLVRDMVFVPDPPLTPRLLGLGHETPRAVPSDLVVALLSQPLAGDLVQKAVLLTVLVTAGVGASRLAPRGAAPGAAAALAATWNPFVAERLAIGQWAALLGYAALPWVLAALADLLRGDPGGRRRPGRALVVALVLGSLGGAPAWVVLGIGLLAGSAGVALATRDPSTVLRRGGWAVAFWVVLALPWAVPALTRPQGLGSDPVGFEVFAPRPDTGLGTLVSVLTGGGVWNSGVVPPGRGTLVGGVAAVLLLLWALLGYVVSRGAGAHALDPAAATYRLPVAVVGGVALVVVLASTWPPLVEPLAAVPGGGVLRDASRQLGPWVLALAVGCGWGVRWLEGRSMPRVLCGLAAAAPVAVLPSVGWGISGVFQPIDYPADVRAAATTLSRAEEPGAVAVLPFEAYRRYAWNGGRASMTPWSRLVDRRVVASSELVVRRPGGPARVAGEDAYADEVGTALRSADPGGGLGRLGVRWLVVDAPAVAPPAGTRVVTDGPHVRVLEVEGPVDASWPVRFDPPAAPTLLGDALWLLACLVAVWATRRPRVSRAAADTAGIR